MKRYTICIIYLLIITTLMAGFPAAIEAASQAQLKAEQQLETQTQKQINANAANINHTESQLVSLKTSLDALNQSIAQNQTNILQKNLAIQELQAEENKEETEREELVQKFNKFLVFTYENGDLEYLDVLLGSTNFEDLLSRWNYVEAILKYNRDLQNKIIGQNKIIISQKVAIGQEMISLQTAVQQEEEIASLKKQTTSNVQVILSGLNSNQRQMEKTRLEQLNTISNIQRELLDQEKEAQMAAQNGPIKNTPGIPQINTPVIIGSGKISSMISFAESFIGRPYVWGGTSPSPGFDCSGFTQYVLHHVDVNIQRTSQAQYLEGSPVAEVNLEPGDLIFFTTYTSGASHVGICIGNGLMIDSEASGVIIDNYKNAYWQPRYLGARRIVQ